MKPEAKRHVSVTSPRGGRAAYKLLLHRPLRNPSPRHLSLWERSDAVAAGRGRGLSWLDLFPI